MKWEMSDLKEPTETGNTATDDHSYTKLRLCTIPIPGAWSVLHPALLVPLPICKTQHGNTCLKCSWVPSRHQTVSNTIVFQQ